MCVCEGAHQPFSLSLYVCMSLRDDACAATSQTVAREAEESSFAREKHYILKSDSSAQVAVCLAIFTRALGYL